MNFTILPSYHQVGFVYGRLHFPQNLMKYSQVIAGCTKYFFFKTIIYNIFHLHLISSYDIERLGR